MKSFRDTDREILKFILMICQMLIIETLYTFFNDTVFRNHISKEAKWRIYYFYWVLRQISVILMMLGLSISITKVIKMKEEAKTTEEKWANASSG